jgi:hypothetical protein
MAPSIVCVLVKATGAWGVQEWAALGDALVRHAAVADRRACIVLHDADAAPRLTAAVQAALQRGSTATGAEVPAGMDVCEAAYTALAGVLGVRLEEDVPAFKEWTTAIRRIMCGMEMIGKAPEDLVVRIQHWQASLFAQIVLAHLKARYGLACSLPRADPFPPRTAGEPISRKAISSNLVRAVRDWFAGCKDRSAALPALLHPKETPDAHAAIIAHCLEACQLEIWNSTLGFTTCNSETSAARLLRAIDYSEAKEMCSHDSKLCDFAVFDALSAKQIPLAFFSPLFPGVQGTVVRSTQVEGIKAIHVQRNITVWSMTTNDMWHVPGFLARVFECFRKYARLVILLCVTHALTHSRSHATGLTSASTSSPLQTPI